ncbi:serine/arginine repetitive matrix protein 3-like [Mauremys mutica]|uniref:serine/arginine repetitive matrix protein 3-like n=1 Tax=Mauremys mutica TaxID=74926 RepID=UPI001D162641|nr:serine/arginine repetitive matrix protein 3-like [Mauremys mutica]
MESRFPAREAPGEATWGPPPDYNSQQALRPLPPPAVGAARSTPEPRTERNQEGRGGQSAVSRPSEERADRSQAKELTHEPASPPDLARRGARTVPPAGSRSQRPLNRTVWDGDGRAPSQLPEAGWCRAPHMAAGCPP